MFAWCEQRRFMISRNFSGAAGLVPSAFSWVASSLMTQNMHIKCILGSALTSVLPPLKFCGPKGRATPNLPTNIVSPEESLVLSQFSIPALHIVQTGSRVHSTSYPMGTGVSFPGVKRQEREADHSHPTSAEVKKMWIYTCTPLYVFMA
jgi:hypothetical protein